MFKNLFYSVQDIQDIELGGNHFKIVMRQWTGIIGRVCHCEEL